MGFFDGLNKLLFGEDTAENKQREQYDKIANQDNRMEDFENLSGTALNNLANRGIVNSSVTSKALGSAMAQAEDNYWDDQMKLLSIGYGEDDKGIAGDLASSATKGIFSSIF